MDLRCIKILNAQGSWVDGTNGGNGISFDTANQLVQEVFELEGLVRSTRDVRPFGNQTNIGSAVETLMLTVIKSYTNLEC